MLHTFVDESYGEDDYYVAGVVVDDDQLVVLEAALLDLKSRISTHFEVADSLELHAHEIMHAKGEWSFLHGQVHESVYICRQVLAAVVDSGSVVHVQGVDVARLNARYRYPDSPYAVSLRHLLERVEVMCRNQETRSSVTLDILDESETATRVIAGYVNNFTPGYLGKKLSRINNPIKYVDSRASLGVQAADMVVYTIRRYLEVHDAHPKAMRASRTLHRMISPSISTCRKWEP